MVPDISSLVSFFLALYLTWIFHSPPLSRTPLLGLKFDGKAVVDVTVVLCEHNPSVLKQGDLASGFPFCISPRPWKFCVSGTTPYWVPKFKNLHKAQEWSVHSCQLYTRFVFLDEKKTLLGNHYCMGEVIYAALITVLLSFSLVLMKQFWCVWKVYTRLSYMLNSEDYKWCLFSNLLWSLSSGNQ